MKILLFILTFNASFVFAQGNTRFENLKLIIDKEISEIDRLSSQVGYKYDLLIKKSELYLEKARIIRMIENEKFFSLPESSQRNINPQTYYVESNSYYLKAKNECEKLIREFPNHPTISDAYYVLAFYQKETGEMRAAENSFHNAINRAYDNKSKKRYQLALAETYYYLNDFKNAILNYQNNIDYSEKWAGKDLFYLGESYYKSGDNQNAYIYFNKALELKGQKQYVDVDDSIYEDLAFVMINLGKYQEALGIIKQDPRNQSANYFSELAKKAENKGQVQVAQKLWAMSVKSQKDDNLKGKKYLEQLIYYAQGENKDRYLQVAKDASSNLLNDELRLEIKNAALKWHNEEAHYIAKNQRSSTHFNHTVSLLDIAHQIDSEKGLYSFLKAELYYGANKYQEAFTTYGLAISEIPSRDTKLLEQNANGLIASLHQLTQNKNDLFYTNMYKILSDQKNANQVFQKSYLPVVNFLIENKKDDQAIALTQNFSLIYGASDSLVRAMSGHFQKNKLFNSQESLMRSIKENKITISADLKEKLLQMADSMELDKAKSAIGLTSVENSLIHYEKIFKETTSPQIKLTSAYNGLILANQKNNNEMIVAWTSRMAEMKSLKWSQDEYSLFYLSAFKISSFLGSSEKNNYLDLRTTNYCNKNLKHSSYLDFSALVIAYNSSLGQFNSLSSFLQNCVSSPKEKNDFYFSLVNLSSSSFIKNIPLDPWIGYSKKLSHADSFFSMLSQRCEQDQLVCQANIKSYLQNVFQEMKILGPLTSEESWINWLLAFEEKTNLVIAKSNALNYVIALNVLVDAYDKALLNVAGQAQNILKNKKQSLQDALRKESSALNYPLPRGMRL